MEGFSIVRASRQGITLTLCSQVWAAVHDALGAIGPGREMDAAAEAGAVKAASLPQLSSR